MVLKGLVERDALGRLSRLVEKRSGLPVSSQKAIVGRHSHWRATTSPDAAPPERVAEFRERLRNLVTQMRAAGVPATRISAELRAAMENLK